MIRFGSTSTKHGRTLFAWAAVAAMALQMLVSTVATAAPGANGVEAAFAASCAAAADVDQAPAAPLSSHHKHGACCFLHVGGAEPPRFADASELLSPPVAHDFAFRRATDAGSIGAAPELGALSPRAPPTL